MGTRHLICIVKDKDYKLAQHGQWDGYPSGQGEDIVNFILTWDRPRFEEHLKNSRCLTSDETHALWKSFGADDSGFVTLDISDKFGKVYAQLDRDSGAKTLEYIQDTIEPVLAPLSLDFAADSFFCEYAYIIDLDKDILEVYRGFNKTKLKPKERFSKLKPSKENDEYQPIKHWISYDFSKLRPGLMTELEASEKEES